MTGTNGGAALRADLGRPVADADGHWPECGLSPRPEARDSSGDAAGVDAAVTALAPVVCLDGLDAVHWPSAAPTDLIAVFANVRSRPEALLPAESRLVAGAGSARLAAFSSGRHAARVALRALGVPDQPVTRRDRVPVWPEGVVGSISHSRSLAVALVARRRRYQGVGVDLETRGRVTPRIAQRVLTTSERANLPDVAWRTALFSAKESVYKAVNPIAGEHLAFADVEIALADAAGRVFAARAVRPCRSAERVAAGRGYWLRYRGHWVTWFLVP